MDIIYFGTTDGDLVTNWNLARMAQVVCGMKIDGDNFNAVRDFAKSCSGITGEIRKPSVKFLLEHGNRVMAIRVYYERHKELGLDGARKAIEALEKMEVIEMEEYKLGNSITYPETAEATDIFSDEYQRQEALKYQRETGTTKYLFDDDGNEYWYQENDTRRHYTRDEG